MSEHPETMNMPILSAALQSVLVSQMKDELQYGVQDYPSGTNGKLAGEAQAFIELAKDAMRQGELSWTHLVLAQTYETLAHSEPGNIRVSLSHLARTIVQWMESLDRAHGGV